MPSLKMILAKYLTDPTLYRRFVGSLVYLTTTTPDISFVVNLASQLMTNHRHLHFAASQQIIQYPQGTQIKDHFFSQNSNF